MKLRCGIGYVIQNAGLMPHQKVIDNVATVTILNGQSRRAARNAAYRVLEQVGLDPELATRYPAELSGGEQQRVGSNTIGPTGCCRARLTALCRISSARAAAIDGCNF